MASGSGTGGRPQWTPLALAATTGATTVALCIAWIPVRASAPDVDLALVLLVVTALVGFCGRRAAVVGSALGAAAGFSYFDVEPYERWAITHGTDVVTTALLVVVGLAAGELSLRLRRQRRAGATEDRRFERVREAATRLAEGEELVPMIGAVAGQLGAILSLASCRFSTEQADEALPAFDRLGVLHPAPAPTGAARLAGPAALPVLSLGVVVGRFVLEPSPATGWRREDVLLAVTLADQVGAALAAQAPMIDPPDPAPIAPPGPRLRLLR